MIKREFIQEVAERSGLLQKDVDEVIKLSLEIIKREVKGGGEVTFNNFGRFFKKDYEERELSHPKTGEIIKVPAHSGLMFKPSQKLREIFK